jgi:hypothetical protein
MSSLFEAPSIAAIATQIAESRLGQAELAEVDDILAEIERLPPEERQRLLSFESTGAEQG